MSTLSFDRRRAERLARLLETAMGGPQHHTQHPQDASLAPLVATARALSQIPDNSGPAPEFRSGLRAMLLATIEREGLGATTRPRPAAPTRSAITSRTQVIRPIPTAASRRTTRSAVIIGMAAGTIAMSGVASANADSLPGDPHYQAKRTGERTQLALAGSDVGRGNLYLEFAANRLREAARSAGRGARAGLLSDMDSATRQGVRLLTTAAVRDHDTGLLESIDQFVTGARAALVDLLRQPPGIDDASAHSSAVLLAAVQQRAQQLSAALAQGRGVGAIDDLGPRPRSG